MTDSEKIEILYNYFKEWEMWITLFLTIGVIYFILTLTLTALTLIAKFVGHLTSQSGWNRDD